MVLAWGLLAALLFQAEDLSEAGLKALDAAQYGVAAKAFEQVIEKEPDNYAAHFNIAFAYSMLGRKAEAISHYEKTLELKPGIYQAELNLGMLLVQSREAERAIPHLRTAAEAKPDEFRPHFYLGKALYDVADDAGAEEQFQWAVKLDPKAADAEVGLGRAIFNQGRYAEAEPHYRRAVQIDPQYRQILIELGSRFEEKSLDEKAIAIYEEFPKVAEVRERLGHLLLRAGRIEEAIPHLQAAVATAPTLANRYALATAYIKSGRPEEALPLIEQALAEQPKNYELLMVHGRLLRDRRQFSAASQSFLGAVEARPDSQEAWKELASMLILLENYPRALAALDTVEALGQAPASIYFFRGMIWDKAGDHPKAAASYERFLELSNGQYPDEEFKARQRLKVVRKGRKH